MGGYDRCPLCGGTKYNKVCAERDRLREALIEVLDVAEECAPYLGEYFADKYDVANRIAKARAALARGKDGEK